MKNFNKRVDQVKWSKGFLTLASLVFCMLCMNQGFAQIESMSSLYRMNPQTINPAHAGSTEHSDVTVLNRQQWLGMEGAPVTYVFSGNFKFKGQSGIGANAMFDQAGPMKITSISGDYAYHTKLSESWAFSGGIRAGVTNLSLDFTGLALTNDGDVMFAGNRSTGLMFNTGWGVKVNKGDGFFVSISQPRVFKYDLEGAGAFKDVPYFFGMVGTKYKINENVSIYPSALFRMAKDVPLSWDANVMLNLKGKLDAGLSYRNGDSWGIRLGVQATEKIYLGYVFEMPTSQLSKVGVQTHEIALRYRLSK